MHEIVDQKNSKYEHFLRTDALSVINHIYN